MIHSSTFVSGLDIGGAHVKVARCDAEGNLIEVKQYPCPLWQGIDKLQAILLRLIDELQNQHDLIAITMTGELVDLFENRQAGVSGILDCVTAIFNEQQCAVYASDKGWLSVEQAKNDWIHVASCNWHASARFVASQVENGLFVDLGSTTCDMIPIVSNQIKTHGKDDFERQTSRELLYTGAIRTPLISLCQMAPLDGRLIGLAAEVFATTGDVWVLLDKLSPDSIQDSSSDNQAWDHQASARRIARLLGTDAITKPHTAWTQLAKWFGQQQMHLINSAALHVLSSHVSSTMTTFVGAGVGRGIIKECAQSLNYAYIDFAELVSPHSSIAADHAPAVAVALLACKEIT